jgi:transcriptional regulator with XRE-family HTH domain
MNPANIKRTRTILGMSQEKFARTVGVSFCTVNRWERGKTVPSPMALKFLKRLKDKADSNDKRSAMRLDLRYPIEVVRLGAKGSAKRRKKASSLSVFSSRTEDLSIGGLMFKSKDDIKMGERLGIELDLGGPGPVEAVSEVVWTLDKGGGRYFGARFDEIAPASRLAFMNTLLLNHPML